MPSPPETAASAQHITAGGASQETLASGAAGRVWHWSPAVQLRMLAVLTIGIWAVPFVHLVVMQEPNTLAHITFAQIMSETGVLFPGHFLFHVSTIAAHAVVPVSWEFANVLVLLIYRLLLAGIIWTLVRNAIRSRDLVSDAVLTIGLSIGLMFAGAVSFLTWPSGNNYLGYLVPNIYVSQTLVVLQPLALLTFFAVIRVFFTGASGHVPRYAVGLALLSALSVLAKPSFAMVLLPALVVLLWWKGQLPGVVITRQDGRRLALACPQDRAPSVILVAGVIVPTLLAIAWVYFSTYLVLQQGAAGTGTGVSIAPLQVMIYLQTAFGSPTAAIPWLALKLGLSLLFPLTVAAGYFSTIRADPRFLLAWLQMGVGLLFTYFLAESPNFHPGNYTWSGQIALSVLFVVSALLLFERTLTSGTARWRTISTSPSAVVCYLALLLHVIGGLGVYLHPQVT
ncbi:MAG: hypothetical protein M3Z20_19940 [Chloroflexota bacterium]|nr:hypothetical protein [Chloroflexota bacterium]